MIYYDERTLDALSSTEYDQLADEAIAYDEELQANGHFVAAHALEGVHAATTVRTRNGKTCMMDGPFAETKEQLGGFLLIDARDLNEAIQLASRIPPARLGSVEVRPIKDIRRAARRAR